MPAEPAPIFLIDRSLGRVQVPQALRAAGWRVVTLAEHYGIPRDAGVSDEEWLALAGHHGWAVLMKDDRIRYRPAEREALIRAKVQAFCLSSGNLHAGQMAGLFLHHASAVLELAVAPGPGLHVISKGGLRTIALDQGRQA